VEDTVRVRTVQFVGMGGAASCAHYAAGSVFSVGAGAGACARDRGLMQWLRVAEKDGRMMDGSRGKGARLVRVLERRQSLLSSPPPPPPALVTELHQSACKRDVLDGAKKELAREIYGCLQEIAPRLAIVGRKEQLAEASRGWVHRARKRRAQRRCLSSSGSTLSSVTWELCSVFVDGAASREDVKVPRQLPPQADRRP
jgi:hypothetical protein